MIRDFLPKGTMSCDRREMALHWVIWVTLDWSCSIHQRTGATESSPSSICPSGQAEDNALAEHAHTMAHTCNCIQKNTINNLVNNFVTSHTESCLSLPAASFFSPPPQGLKHSSMPLRLSWPFFVNVQNCGEKLKEGTVNEAGKFHGVLHLTLLIVEECNRDKGEGKKRRQKFAVLASGH